MTPSQLRAYALPTALFMAFVFLLIQLYAYWQQNRPVFDDQGKLLRLPEFVFPTLQGDGQCTPDVLHKGPVVVVYYGPDCGHCRQLGKELATTHAEINAINWVFVSRAPVEEAKAYVRETGLAAHPSIHFCRDEHARFYGFFGEMYIPSAYVFDSDRRFLQSLHQNTTVTDILSVLHGKAVYRHKETK